MMSVSGDVLGLVFVYGYVAVLLVVTEKVFSKRYPVGSRKALHILVGNIAFLLPVFETRWVMAFLAAGPFIVLTFLMSPYSPIEKIRGKTSQAGHGLGLVYYAITWTVLAFLFFDRQVVIAIAILAMSYGDGCASLVGLRYPGRLYRVFTDVKSVSGSVTMFLATFVVMILAVLYYGELLSTDVFFILLGIAAIAAVAEGATPRGLDNLSVPFVAAGLYWLLLLR